MTKPDLIDELKDAMMSRNRAQSDLDDEMLKLAGIKAAIRDRRESLALREKALREIEHELLTGEPSLPLLAAPAARAGGNGRVSDYDRDLAAAVEEAERRRAAPAAGRPEELLAAGSDGDAGRRPPPAAPVPQAREGEPAAGWTDASILAALEADPDLEIEIPRRVGPPSRDDAIVEAIREVRSTLDPLRTAGASDEDILRAMHGLATERRRYPEGLSWATVGGLAPGIWIGDDADAWPARGATLAGADLAAAIRKLLKIPRPTPADGKPARRPDGEPAHDGADLAGYRRCSRAEYRAAAAADRHPRWRAVRTPPAAGAPDIAETRPDGGAAESISIDPPAGGWDWESARAAIDRLQGPGKKGGQTVVCRGASCRKARRKDGRPCICGEIAWDSIADVVAGRDVASMRPAPAGPARDPAEWRSEDLDATLRAALGWGGAAERLTYPGRSAAAGEILEELGSCWENAGHIHKHAKGYRVRGGKSPAFWMGEDASRKPTLDGPALVDRVRRVLELGDKPPAAPKRGRQAARAKDPAAGGAWDPATDPVPAPIAGGAPAADVRSGARDLAVPEREWSAPDPPIGWRPCTASEWILAGPGRRHPLYRLVREGVAGAT